MSNHLQKSPGTEDPAGGDRADAVQETASRTVIVHGKHGLHMRVCSAIVSTVCRHQAKVTIHKGGQTENAASILGLLSLAASRGTTLVLSAVGPEAEDVLEAVLPIFDGAAD